MDFNQLLQSRAFKVVFSSIILLILALLVFTIGLTVGFRKASFSYQWGENYHRNFAGPRGGFFQDLLGEEFIESHGVFGQIIKIDAATLVIKGRDNVEKIVLVRDDTAIKNPQGDLQLTDLQVNDLIVVIGDPDDQGQILAKLIRVMPPAPGPGAMMPFPYR